MFHTHQVLSINTYPKGVVSGSIIVNNVLEFKVISYIEESFGMIIHRMFPSYLKISKLII